MNRRPLPLRPFTEPDVPRVHAMIRDIFAEFGMQLVLEEEPHLRDPAGYFRKTGGELWLVEEGGELVATCGVVLQPDLGELKALYVRRDQRRRGLGRQLVRHAIAFARSAGCEQFYLWTDTRFLEAHRLYTQLGFCREGMRELRDSNNTIEFAFLYTPSDPDCAQCARLREPPLQTEPWHVLDMPSGRLTLQNDAAFRGYCILAHWRHVTELHDLSQEERQVFIEDIARVSRALQMVVQPGKINYAMLGNQDPHLHCHVIPRFSGDGWWGKPIWLRPAGEQRPLQMADAWSLRDALRALLRK